MRAFSTSPFAQVVFTAPRFTKPALASAPLSPSKLAGADGGLNTSTGSASSEADRREHWVRKVHELTLQLQESSMFWVNKVRSLNNSIDDNKKRVMEAFSEHATRTKQLIHTLLQAFVTTLQHLYTIHYRGFAQPTLLVDVSDFVERIQQQLAPADLSVSPSSSASSRRHRRRRHR